MSTDSHLLKPIGPLYLDDLSVGQRFVSSTYVVDEPQIKVFAKQYDPQPFHMDEVAAQNTLFGGLVASGWHTAAITMRLMVENGIPIAGGLIGAGVEITWPKPTRPGSTLQVESEIMNVKPSQSRPDRGIATVRSKTRDQNGDIVQIMVSNLIVPRRTTVAPS